MRSLCRLVHERSLADVVYFQMLLFPRSWFDVGPASKTMFQHQTNHGSIGQYIVFSRLKQVNKNPVGLQTQYAKPMFV